MNLPRRVVTQWTGLVLMPIEGFLALAFFPSPDFFFLTLSWDWVLHYSIQNNYSWAEERQ